VSLQIVGDVALLRLDNGKAIAINPELLATLDRALDEFDESLARALVITGYDRYFSAGLDLPTVATFDRRAMTEFMGAFESVMQRQFRCMRPIVAAVNGHAVAGGCVLALQADVRVMAQGAAEMGLNETRLGVGLPPCAAVALTTAVPYSSAFRVAVEGRLFEPDDCLALGLVDEVVPAERVVGRALERAQELADVPALAYQQTKAAVRGDALAALDRATEEDGEEWLDLWFSEDAQRLIRQAVSQLTRSRG